MDKRSIVGIAVVALLFLGFAFFNAREQKKLQEQKAIWEAYQDSLAAVQRAAQSDQQLTLTDAKNSPAAVAAGEFCFNWGGAQCIRRWSATRAASPLSASDSSSSTATLTIRVPRAEFPSRSTAVMLTRKLSMPSTADSASMWTV